MIDDTSFETHRQQETRDFILQLHRLVAEKDAEIERLKALCTRAADALDTGNLAILDELRKAAE